jgi:alanyl-tRNA synthetase
MLCLEFGGCEGKVVGLRKYGKEGFVKTVEAGEEIGVILDRTCFYAEQGGQVRCTPFSLPSTYFTTFPDRI